MSLRTLQVEQLRNCQRLDLDCDAPLVIITGPNGAGKSTVLEAIYLLARGRTFRSRKAGTLITRSGTRTRLRGHLTPDDRVLDVKLDRSGLERLVDGVPWSGVHERTPPLHVRLIGENAQSLLEGDPALRRTFLDWNVFHVEPSLGRVRTELRRVLAQRNAALRQRPEDAWLWDHALIECSTQLDTYRQRFLERWQPAFADLTDQYPALAGSKLRWRRGWAGEQSLAQQLIENRERERARGYSLYGAHRAELTLVREEMPLRLSRGQTKAAVCLLQLAAEAVHQRAGLAPALWLLDDLFAELDHDTTTLLLNYLAASGGQRFLTQVASHPKRETACAPGDEPCAVFHVEQGAVRGPGPEAARQAGEI